jgi:hypothetical protein
MAISKKAEAQIEKPRSSALKMKNPQQNPPAEALSFLKSFKGRLEGEVKWDACIGGKPSCWNIP